MLFRIFRLFLIHFLATLIRAVSLLGWSIFDLTHHSENDWEDRTLTYLACDVHSAAHLLNDHFANWQTQTTARWVLLAMFVKVVEVYKKLVDLLGWDATAKISDTELELDVARAFVIDWNLFIHLIFILSLFFVNTFLIVFRFKNFDFLLRNFDRIIQSVCFFRLRSNSAVDFLKSTFHHFVAELQCLEFQSF